ncbi:MAG: hypothetical protein K2H33_04760 [Muribaculaceae bacterium]|nr:hypothetical protein [Muribaculaceae bacterium]MDE6315526.1 hypothetical protein [Muribaculaceae bacterium]
MEQEQAQHESQAAQQAPTAEAMDLAARLAEAEMRGYKRGLNEQIAVKMAEPGVYEPLSGRRRGSVWDS